MSESSDDDEDDEDGQNNEDNDDYFFGGYDISKEEFFYSLVPWGLKTGMRPLTSLPKALLT